MPVATLPVESEAYRAKRVELHEAELELRAQRIRVAALRRALPLDTPVEDYVFVEGPADPAVDEPVRRVTLPELFAGPDRPLVLYHFMYGGAQTTPCPSCSMWIDGFDAVARHVAQRAPVRKLREWARTRGWTSLRLLSAEGSTFKSDLGSQTADGKQLPLVSVFAKTPDGSVRHFYSGGAMLGDGAVGGLDQLTPVWNLFDLTPAGRGDWYPALEYGS
jgi:predicted dithiol-disulfide oxidoreductase (DUF899 family)